MWLSAHGDCASTALYPTVDWSMAPVHAELDKTIQLEPFTELAEYVSC